MTSIDGGATWQAQTLPALPPSHLPYLSAVSFGALNDSVQAFGATINWATFEGGGQVLSYRQRVGYIAAALRRVPQQYATIQSAINASADGDTVLVSEGTYFESIKYRGKKIIVGSQFLLDRDSMHIGRTIINGSQSIHPDSGSVVSFLAGEDTNSVLCGFTIRGGKGTVIGTMRAGGGVFLYRSGGKILNCHLVGNTVEGPYLVFGGGISSFSDTNPNLLIVRDCLIDSNRVRATINLALGGGMYLGCTSTIENNIVRFNEAFYQGNNQNGSSAGGIYVGALIRNFHVKIFNNQIIRNTTINVGGFGAYAPGLDLYDVSFTVTKNVISHNTLSSDARGYGCGLRVVYGSGSNLIAENTISFNGSDDTPFTDGGGILLVRCNNVTVRKNIFEGNQSTWGGGIEDYQTVNTVIEENDFVNNSATNCGGALRVESNNALVTNNIMRGNSAAFGGAVYVYTTPSGANENGVTELERSTMHMGRMSLGGEGYQQKSPIRTKASSLVSAPVFMNNTIVNNTGTSTGGGMLIANGSQPLIFNSILWGNTGGQIAISSGSAEVHYSDIQDGWPSGTGNINADPIFVDTLFRIANASPCNNRGTDSMQVGGVWYRAPRTDLFGNPRPRPIGSKPDMGSHELQTLTSVENTRDIPDAFSLLQNYPNPFNPSTEIQFSVAEKGQATLEVFNILGQKVATLFDDVAEAGQYYKVQFNAASVASGVYLYRLQSAGQAEVRRLLLLR